jgi:TonB-dependent Receptor Plug Domain
MDPDVPSSVMQIGSQQVQDRLGRSVQDLVDSQPGWLYEGNAVLHPRGSEYQTQFVVDGIPLTDNRSPSFGPEMGADNLSSLSIYTAGFPAEYGRKLGGVVELNTQRGTDPGLHGQFVLSGGTYATAASFGELQYLKGKNMYGVSASGSMTSHYLNPVVPENYTNAGTTGDFSRHYDRDFSCDDRLTLSVRHEFSRFLIPNELLQEQAGQRQYGDKVETMSMMTFQHLFSANGMATFAAMVRNNSNNHFESRIAPIVAFQHNYFTEGYFKSSFSYSRGRQEFKAGVESDNTILHENFSYHVTDPSQFDPDTPPDFSFVASRPDLEQSASSKISSTSVTGPPALVFVTITISCCSTSTRSARDSRLHATSQQRTSCSMLRSTEFFRHPRSRTFSSPVRRRSMRSVISFCVSQLSPPAEIIGKAVWRKRYSNLAVSTSTSTGAMSVTSRTTINISILV